MSHTPFFSPKRTGETLIITFDFRNILTTGETIESSVWSVGVKSGSDPSPSSMLSGSPSISGTLVSHKVTGGVDKTVYSLLGQIVTSIGQTIEGVGLVHVTDS